MSAIPAYRRPVNMVFQNYAIFPHLDVRGNISFGLRKSGLSKAEINTKVEEMLELIKLQGYEERSGTFADLALNRNGDFSAAVDEVFDLI